jgi:hypothetical protein
MVFSLCGYGDGAQGLTTTRMLVQRTADNYISPYIREPFSTSYMLALVGFFAGMSTDVNGEGAPLDETLSTTWRHARVRSLICMDAVVSLEVRLSVEALEYLISSSVNPFEMQ